MAIAAASAAAAACAGPVEPLNVQTQALPVGLVLGQHAAVVQAPLAPVSLPPRPVGQQVFTPPAVPPATPVGKPHLGPCPAFDPLAPVGIVNTAPSKPPLPTSYTYRSKIDSNTAGTKASYDGPTKWTVSQSSAPNSVGDYTFQTAVKVPVAGFSKTTTYEVVPTGVQAAGEQVPPGNIGGNPEGQLPTSAPVIASPEQPGIYLAGVSEDTGSSSTSFVPASPIPLVQFPIQVGASFTTSGTDGNSVISYTSTVTKLTKVNACGTPVGAWQVDLTSGSMSSDSQPQVAFTETLFFAPQSGCIVVGDSYSSSGSQLPAGTVTYKQTDTINTEPKAT